VSLGRINLLLAVLVAVLGVAVWLGPGSPESRHLTTLDPAAIRQVVVRRPGQAELRFERDARGWRRVAPTPGAADPGRLNRLVQIAAATPRRQLPGARVDAAAAGLAPPLAVLELDGRRLELGATEPVNDRRYVRTGGQVYLIDDRYPLPAAPGASLSPPTPR
jgi:hypothetical protein